MRRSLLPLLLLAAACGRSAPTDEEVAAARRRGEEAAAALVSSLQQKLTEALSSGPPEQAIEICSRVAQEISRKVAREQGVSLRRTALRVRNANNAPDPWERAWMEAEVARLGAGGEIRLTPHGEVRDAPGGGKELRLLRAIHTGTLCLACHGGEADISPATRAAISARYPEDRATGFAANDFRGALSVRVALR